MEITNLYVVGFPNGVRKSELWKLFARFGQVVDVYLGRKKDYRMKNFAFVRFRGVEDEKVMEERLQGTTCRDVILNINLSKHKRKSLRAAHQNIPQHQNNRNNIATHMPMSYPPTVGFRDKRTFAQVMSESRRDNMTFTRTITLKSETAMKTWINGKTLIGEAHNMDHMANLPASTFIKENVKYLGSLNIALGFGSSVMAREFLEAKNTWQDWFKWMKHAEQLELPYERIAWIKIIGLPLRLFDEENFSKITGSFGKVIAPFDNISTKKRLLHGEGRSANVPKNG